MKIASRLIYNKKNNLVTLKTKIQKCIFILKFVTLAPNFRSEDEKLDLFSITKLKKYNFS